MSKKKKKTPTGLTAADLVGDTVTTVSAENAERIREAASEITPKMARDIEAARMYKTHMRCLKCGYPIEMELKVGPLHEHLQRLRCHCAAVECVMFGEFDDPYEFASAVNSDYSLKPDHWPDLVDGQGM